LSLDGLNEQIVKDVLVEMRGDLIRASEKMCVRPSKLVQWIKSVPSVSALWMEMEKVKSAPEFDRVSQAQFEEEIKVRTSAYKLEGLEVIHELATTDHKEVASMAEVRLKAAIQLRGAGENVSIGGDTVLHELNALYHRAAPRIRSMRAVQIDFDVDEAPVVSEVVPIAHG
jgi:hypothetical protein